MPQGFPASSESEDSRLSSTWLGAQALDKLKVLSNSKNLAALLLRLGWLLNKNYLSRLATYNPPDPQCAGVTPPAVETWSALRCGPGARPRFATMRSNLWGRHNQRWHLDVEISAPQAAAVRTSSAGNHCDSFIFWYLVVAKFAYRYLVSMADTYLFCTTWRKSNPD